VVDHADMQAGLVRNGFSELKQKLLCSIVAIIAVYLLEWLLDIECNCHAFGGRRRPCERPDH
jgi:uncharacterized membrane protein YqhA